MIEIRIVSECSTSGGVLTAHENAICAATTRIPSQIQQAAASCLQAEGYDSRAWLSDHFLVDDGALVFTLFVRVGASGIHPDNRVLAEKIYEKLGLLPRRSTPSAVVPVPQADADTNPGDDPETGEVVPLPQSSVDAEPPGDAAMTHSSSSFENQQVTESVTANDGESVKNGVEFQEAPGSCASETSEEKVEDLRPASSELLGREEINEINRSVTLDGEKSEENRANSFVGDAAADFVGYTVPADPVDDNAMKEAVVADRGPSPIAATPETDATNEVAKKEAGAEQQAGIANQAGNQIPREVEPAPDDDSQVGPRPALELGETAEKHIRVIVERCTEVNLVQLRDKGLPIVLMKANPGADTEISRTNFSSRLAGLDIVRRAVSQLHKFPIVGSDE